MIIHTHHLKSATQPITICPLGDIQWSGDEEDLAYDLLERHISDCLSRPTPLFVGMGDAIDFASPSNREALENSRLYDTAKKVIANATKDLVDDLYARLLKPTRGKWLGLTQGHHHHPAKIGELPDGTAIMEDSDVYLSKLLKAKWLDEMGVIKIVWPGGGVFRVLVFHGSGSSVFPWGPLVKLYRLMPHFHVDLLLQGHHCLPVRTRILTSRGFKHHDEVLIGEPVLAYSLATGTCKWTPLQDVTVYKDAPLVRARSRSFRIEMTPGHQLVFRKQNGIEYIAPFEEAKSYESVVINAIAEPGTSNMSDREASILGWLVTDGHMGWKDGYPNFQIGQKKETMIEVLRELLGDDATIHDHVRHAGMKYFYLRASLARRLHEFLPDKEALPRIIPTLSRSARQAMLAAMIQAEGDGVHTFSQKAGPVWDAFLMLAAMEGIRCGLRKSQPSGFKEGTITYRTKLLIASRSGQPTFGYAAIDPIESGDVWCPTTKYGTWVAEQDGSTFITGNTKKALAEIDRLEFPVDSDDIKHLTIKMVGTGGWTKGYINGRRTYVSAGALGPVALGQPLIHIRPRIRKGVWEAGMTVES